MGSGSSRVVKASPEKLDDWVKIPVPSKEVIDSHVDPWSPPKSEPSHQRKKEESSSDDSSDDLDSTPGLYVLVLKNDKYYVGKTSNISRRLKDHFSGKGSEWTRKYSPIEIVEVIKNFDDFDEDKMVKKYMKRYGIENVRGGSYSQIILSREQLNCLTKELETAKNACFRCGQPGHFIKNCPKSETKSKQPEVTVSRKLYCTRCGRNSHNVERCYAKTKLNGTPL